MAAVSPNPEHRYESASEDVRGESRPISALFSELWRETLTLFRDEAELAKAELNEKVTQVTHGAVEISMGGAVLFAGFLTLLGAAVGALMLFMQTEHEIWLAPLIVGIVVLIAGWIMVARGRSNLKASNLAPNRTMTAMRDDARFAKEQFR